MHLSLYDVEQSEHRSECTASGTLSFSCLQVELVGMSYIGLSAVVDFLYSGELPLDGGNIDYVLEAANLLQVRKWAIIVQHIMLDI